MRSNNFIFAFIFFVGATSSAYADRSEYPLLKDTELYKKTTNQCQEVDAFSWKHPIKSVFEKYSLKIENFELCNNGNYPIFHINLKYDPESGGVKKYYTELYFNLLKSNGNWPLSIVDTADEEIVNISVEKRQIFISNEFYRSSND